MAILKQKTKQESKFGYKNKFNNKEFTFNPKSDQMIATYNPGETEDFLTPNSLGQESYRVSYGNPDRQFAILEVPPSTKIETAASALTRQKGIANTIPVLVDQEGLTRYFMPDELTVQFNDNVSKSDAEKLIKELGSEIIVQQRTPGYYTVSVPAGKGLFETLDAYSANPKVKFAEPSEFGVEDALRSTVNGSSSLREKMDGLPAGMNAAELFRRLQEGTVAFVQEAGRRPSDLQVSGGSSDEESYMPDDSFFNRLWGLHNVGQSVNGITGTADADIDAPEAWDYTRGRTDVIVAVIDTGCNLAHPDLAANILPRGAEDWDFADAGDSIPEDSGFHGTHVCGTVAAVDNATGVIGVAPQCRLMPLRVDLTTGMNANRADAINYVAAQAIANPNRRYVINCSWRMNGDHAGVHNAIINAVSKNVVVCFAAGNDNNNIDVTPQYPAVYPEVVAVGATDSKDVRASFSNYGTKVDVSAPGVNIYSTLPGNSYGFLDGTSMASPHAAGVAALIWSRNKKLTNQQVRDLLQNNCDNIDAKNPGFAGKLGKGRINAFRALSNTPAPEIDYKVLTKIKFPQKNDGSSTGLSFTPKFFLGGLFRPVLMFLTQKPFSERIYYLNPGTGAVLGSIDPAANDTIGSLEWDGKYIQVANVTTGSGFINAINPQTGAQVGSMAVPAGRGEALTIVGPNYFYSTINRIYVINRTTGAVVRSFIPPGGPCYGLAYGDGLVFSANSITGVITAFDPNTLVVKGTLNAPGAGTQKAQALAYDAVANRLYVANQSENLIYALTLTL